MENELFIIALKEQFSKTIGDLIVSYEEKLSKLRVALTLKERELNEIKINVEEMDKNEEKKTNH